MFRILEVELSGIKDVNHGEISFREESSFRKGDFGFQCPGIIGLYGQNGSGKTAVIDSFRALKLLAMGVPLYQDSGLAFIVSRWKKKASLSFSFIQGRDNRHYLMKYSVRFGFKGPNDPKLSLEGESFSSSAFDEKKGRFAKFIPDIEVNFRDHNVLDAISRDRSFQLSKIFGSLPSDAGKTMEKTAQLMAEKSISGSLGQSFLFSDRFLSLLTDSKNNDSQNLRRLLIDLRIQLRNRRFVYLTADEALGSLGMGELMGMGVGSNEFEMVSGVFPLQTNGSFFVADSDRSLYESLIKQINTVLPAFVPNFQIKLNEFGVASSPNGKLGKMVEAMSVVGGTDIPLFAESNGIKKIVAVCSAIIHMYNKSDVWLFIDEFDSGVFEFLFGQILQILGESAKGQLMFTSHNLRPLEVLNHNDIYVSTANPDDRYVKLVNIKPSNNVRDFYFRALQIGGQKECLYNATEASEIALALRKGGKIIDDLKNRKQTK